MASNRTFCSRRAQHAGATLAGTATEATQWLLVEVPDPWGRNALADSRLPTAVKSHLLAWEAAAAGRRVQFIRRETRVFDAPDRITVFAARVPARSSAPSPPPALYAFHLADYGDILDLDLGRLPEPHGALRGDRRTEPIFLTCTNGRRDACCAKWGRAMASALAGAAPRHAWQTTHLGGHRFAPTLLVLPHGSQYGWLEPNDAEPLVAAHRSGRLYRLDRYRGHVGFPRPVQAAAVFLREQLGRRALDALTRVHTAENGRSSRVRLGGDGRTYDVTIRHEEGEPMALSCGAAPKSTPHFMPVSCHPV